MKDKSTADILDNLDTAYGDECELSMAGTGREVRCPAYLEPCEYVRIVIDRFEIAYWDLAEWTRAG